MFSNEVPFQLNHDPFYLNYIFPFQALFVAQFAVSEGPLTQDQRIPTCVARAGESVTNLLLGIATTGTAGAEMMAASLGHGVWVTDAMTGIFLPFLDKNRDMRTVLDHVPKRQHLQRKEELKTIKPQPKMLPRRLSLSNLTLLKTLLKVLSLKATEKDFKFNLNKM